MYIQWLDVIFNQVIKQRNQVQELIHLKKLQLIEIKQLNSHLEFVTLITLLHLLKELYNLLINSYLFHFSRFISDFIVKHSAIYQYTCKHLFFDIWEQKNQ